MRAKKLDRGLRDGARLGVWGEGGYDRIGQFEALRREGAFWVRVGLWSDDEKARMEPFDAVELDLSRWWKGIKPPKQD